MGSNRATVNVIPKGMITTDPINKFSWIQNLYKNKGNYWESRDGFGTVARFNCSSTPIPWVNSTDEIPDPINIGYDKHLGSHLIRTDFGHDQIISVFLCKSYITGDNPKYNSDSLKAFKKSDYLPFYAVSIFDVTTNNRYETLLYSHTGEQRDQQDFLTGRTFNNAYLHGFYETRVDIPGFFQRVILGEESEFWFHEYQDKLIFGSKNCPSYVYDPSVFNLVKGKFIANALQRSEINDGLSNPYGEENIITPLSLKDGPLSDGYAYLQQDDLPKFVDATTVANRVVYAAGKTLYFADSNIPNSIIGDESFTLDIEDDIVAIQNWNNNIIVWTSFEMVLYQPSLTSQLLSLGGAIPVSNKVGCLNPKCVSAIDNGVYWVDNNGIYFTNNGLKVSELSEGIGLFFTDYITNPMCKYFINNGLTDFTSDNSNYELSLNGSTDLAHLIYDQKYQQLMFVVPELSIAWILKGGWYMWNFTSDASDDSSKENYLDPPFLLTRDEEIYMIGSEQKDPVFQAVYDPASEQDEKHLVAYNKSFALLEWKRGGATDGSVTSLQLEDWRATHGYQEMNSVDPVNADVKIYFDKPIRKTGLLSPSSIVERDIDLEDTVFLIPIRLTPLNASIINISKLNIEVLIDDFSWNPITLGGSTLPVVLPTRRSGTGEGWDVQWDSINNIITITYDHALVTNSSFNGMRVNHNNKNDLLYIALRSDNTLTTSNIAVRVLDCTVTSEVAGIETDFNTFRAYTYQKGIAVSPIVTEQAVDWILKPNYIGMEDQQQIKSRGTYNKVLSHGGSNEPVVNWGYGLMNQIVGSDYKDYTTQLIDVAGTNNVIGDNLTNIVDVETIRNRVTDSAGALTKTTFDNDLHFDDNYLIRDAEFNSIATSDGTRGEEIGYTFFGYLKNKAEKIIIASIDAVVFAVGGKRRRGR